jgi:hypothetical protein
VIVQTETTAEAYQAGQQVELIRPLRGRPELAAGMIGEVIVGSEAALPWGAVGVQFPLRGGRAGLYQVLPHNLKLAQNTAADVRPAGGDQAPGDARLPVVGGVVVRSTSERSQQPRCQGQTKAGAPCGAFALPERPWCWSHDPERAEQAAAARQRGAVNANKLRALQGRRPRLDTPQALVRYTAGIILDVAEGQMFADVGRVVLYGISIQMRLVELSDMERRLAALEARAALGKGQRWGS